jgi:hypothetical protein
MNLGEKIFSYFPALTSASGYLFKNGKEAENVKQRVVDLWVSGSSFFQFAGKL